MSLIVKLTGMPIGYTNTMNDANPTPNWYLPDAHEIDRSALQYMYMYRYR